MKKMGLQTSAKTRAGVGTKRTRAPKKAADVGGEGSSGNEDTPKSKKVKTDDVECVGNGGENGGEKSNEE